VNSKDEPINPDELEEQTGPPPPNGVPSPSAVRFWKQVANMTSIGWNTVLPIAGGVLLGHYLDKRTGGEYMWTVGLLVGGIMIAFYNMIHILTKDLNE
jgi:predicted F0F1-ATPase subunit